jgi:hypothetical protein
MVRKAERDGDVAERDMDVNLWAGADWGPPDPLSDGGEQGLRALLLRRLAHTVSGGKETFAQHIVQKLITDALQGNSRALQEIFALIEGQGAARESGGRYTQPLPAIDQRTVSRILEVTHDDRDDPPVD